jgi:hypothetical protein
MIDEPLYAYLTPKLARADLRPLSTSELIDRGFTLYRAHFAGFLLLALLSQMAPLLGQLLVTTLNLLPQQDELLSDPLRYAEKTGVLIAIAFASQIIVFTFEVVFVFYIADAYLGRLPSLKASLLRMLRRLPAAVLTCVLNWFLLCGAAVFPLLAAFAIIIVGDLSPPRDLVGLIVYGIGGVLLLVVSVAPLLIVFMRLMVTVPALALEDLVTWRAVQRSSNLVRYDPGMGILYWGEMRLSFLLLPLFIIELLVLSLTSLPLTLHEVGEVMRHGITGQMALPPDAVLIASQILTFLAGSLILPLYLIATTLFYYDIRIRREGYDLEFMAAQLQEAA